MDTEKTNIFGASNLIDELNLYFGAAARDMKSYRNGKPMDSFEVLGDSEMFDIAIKLLNVSDKIKKLNVVEVEQTKEQRKITNVQDMLLNGNLAK